ncbi:MAG: glycosyl hydrolase 53 family protein [Planctomycetia bacterium]|nr:glycosyl hydrolase 53 family protein [Planctomycetia bacterium]
MFVAAFVAAVLPSAPPRGTLGLVDREARAADAPGPTRPPKAPPATPSAPQPPPPVAPTSRPFRMGFTRWPADLTEAGVRRAVDFAHAHGDLVSVMVIGGLPWPEALAGAPFSADVTRTLSYRPPGGQAVFLSISPLDMTRRALAPHWGERDNQPLPAPWAGRAFDHPDVVKAFVAFCLRAVDLARPAVLAVGVENNILLTTDPKAWPALKRLHRAAYAAVKRAHPALPVCFTTDVNHYRGHAKEADRALQEAEVADLLRDSDLFALSVYPFMSLGTPRPVPDDFLDFAPALGKPVAISESGMTSRDVRLATHGVTLRGSDDEQRHWIDLLCRVAARDRYRFVVQFATTDFPALVARLPAETADLARIWAFTGLQDDAGVAKPALAAWDRWFAAPYAPR